ncbi:MAG: DUF805 domain-containing protein [Cyanobium sp. Prado107]|jgi:uncharacterized membrane protein YhaH (DUF805 family)|nr:DUF805 domain-containing protein [Cyanobium sp. Prado107]
MRIVEAFTSAWTRSFDYQGRSNRGDYWWFVLANFIVLLVLYPISKALYNVYSVATIVPGIPLAVRRLRDIGKPWPWILLGLIPIIGTIWLIVLFCQPSLSI